MRTRAELDRIPNESEGRQSDTLKRRIVVRATVENRGSLHAHRLKRLHPGVKNRSGGHISSLQNASNPAISAAPEKDAKVVVFRGLADRAVFFLSEKVILN